MIRVADPASNVAPRYAGERYEGWKLVEVNRKKNVALNCAIQGSPVPITRYVQKLEFLRRIIVEPEKITFKFLVLILFLLKILTE